MTPLHLEILLWYYGRASEYSFEGNETRLRFARDLVQIGVLVDDPEKDPSFFITPKGRFFIEYIIQLPMPEQKWVMPTPDTDA